MTEVPELVRFTKYVDFDSGEYEVASILEGYLDPEEYDAWERKLYDATGFRQELPINFVWNTKENIVWIE